MRLMRLMLIVLLLTACAPMAAPPEPGATAFHPGSPPQTAWPSDLPPVAGEPTPMAVGAAATPVIAAPPTGAPAETPTAAPAFQRVNPATTALLAQISATRLHADLLALQGFRTRHSASA